MRFFDSTRFSLSKAYHDSHLHAVHYLASQTTENMHNSTRL